jgi:hypothetical protein
MSEIALMLIGVLKQGRRGTRLEGGHGGAAAQASRGGGPGCGNWGCGVGGYRCRRRKERR